MRRVSDSPIDPADLFPNLASHPFEEVRRLARGPDASITLTAHELSKLEKKRAKKLSPVSPQRPPAPLPEES